MIDPSAYQPRTPMPVSGQEGPVRKKVFRMGENDRMAGAVPIWEGREKALSKIEQELSQAARGGSKEQPEGLAYAPDSDEGSYYAQPEEEFGFADLLDMINPLHHIPLVGNVYRYVTGDDIKPSSQIIGGAVYGGFMGAASGLVNAIAKEETGKDVSENVLALVIDDKPSAAAPEIQIAEAQPEERLEQAVSGELSPQLLGFTNLNAYLHDSGPRYKTVPVAAGRSAGTMRQPDYDVVPQNQALDHLPPRTPITQVRFSSFPLTHSYSEEN